jgi:hypothetical protein
MLNSDYLVTSGRRQALLEIRDLLTLEGTLDVQPRVPAKPQPTQNIGKLLERLFEWQDSAMDRYSWLDLAGDGIPIFQLEAINAPVLRASGVAREWNRFVWDDPNLNNRSTLNISVPAAIRAELPASLQICVSFDQGIIAPDALAHVYSAGFAVGAAAHWVLSNFQDDAVVKQIGDPDLITPLMAQITDYAQFGTTSLTFEARLAFLADSVPLETQGIIRGWNAIALARSTGDADLMKAIRGIIFSRFSWGSLGETTSYCLSYLIGYYRARALDGAPIPADAALSLETLRRLSADPTAPAYQSIAQGERDIGDIFAALLELTNVSASAEAKLNIHKFLIGFNRGLILSAPEIFYRAVQLGYGIGFRNGFRTGYTRGQKDGYRGGFRAGLGNFFDDIVQITGNVRKVAEVVGKVIGIFG